MPDVLDYLDIAPGFGIVRLHPRPSWVGKTLRELDFGGRLNLTPIALRRGANVVVNPHRDERLGQTDELVLVGRDDRLEKLTE